jgi:hypothetical protein
VKGPKKDFPDLKDVRYPYKFLEVQSFFIGGEPPLRDPAREPRRVILDEFE